MHDAKSALRTRMRMVSATVDDRLLRSVQLWALVAALPEYAASTTVMAYVGVRDEPDTDPLLARIAADGKRLVLPRVVGPLMEAATGELTRRGSFGIPEPDGPAVDPTTIDLVIVPGLAFTADGRRLGQGKGYYDRFLPTTTAVAVGACFAELLLDDVPVEAHDVRLHRVVSA